MKKFILILICLFSIPIYSSSQLHCPYIIVDQFGYPPDAKKIAVIRDPQTGFDADESYEPGNVYSVLNIKGEKVFTGVPVAWGNGATHSGSGDKAWHFDFSALKDPGVYYILDEKKGQRSVDFIISPSVYNEVLRQAMRTFFYQRAGFAKDAQFAGEGWSDDASHLGPGQDMEARNYLDKTNSSTARDVSGGWYDAGDFNKYTNWTANYVVEFLKAYMERPEAWGDDYNIPESGNGIPDILDETKWGMDHLLRMQQEDGSVLSIVGLSHASPPSAATGPSYWGPANTSATNNTAAAFALGSKVYRDAGFEAYADTLLGRALKAWNWGEANPDVLFNNNDPAFGSSGLGAGRQEVNDYERLMIKLEAACYLFEVTGDVQFRDFFDANYEQNHMIQWNYSFPFESDHQDILLYYTSLENATPTIRENIRTVYKNTMMNGTDNLPAHIGNRDPYKAYIKDYTWGSNSVKSAQGNMFYYLVALDIPEVDSIVSTDAAMTYIHYIHGVNPLNFVYLSNMYSFGAENGVNEFYHTWFSNGSSKWDRVGKSTYGPAPGYLTGGPNPSYDWDGCCPSGCGSASNNSICTSESISPPKDQPQQKSYKDFNTSWPLNSWSVTENSCGYQVRYIRLLSKFVNLELDCNGDPGGSAFIDSCGSCAGGNTGITPVLISGECGFPADCAGIENGAAFIDSCGNCAGGTTGIAPVLDTLLCSGMPEEYQATFIFRDAATNEPLWSVNVMADEVLMVSDNEGKTVFSLTEGEHTVEFKKLSYREENLTIQIHSDSAFNFFLTRTHANLKFRLHHQNTPVNNAQVRLGADSLLSNSLGIANFQQLAVPQTYEYFITREEYENQEGSIDLTEDSEIEIEMIQKPSSVLVDPSGLGMKIWPNPTAGPLFITFSKIPENAEIQISDLNGRIFISERIDTKETEISLDFLDKGLYMLSYFSETEKLVILLVRI